MSSKSNTTKTTTSSTRSYKVDAHGIVRDRKITNKTITTNATTNHTTSTANKIGKVLPSGKQFLAILLFLPVIMLALVITFDLPNYTFFETITVNGQELIKFDAFRYLQNIENTASLFKTMLNNTFAINVFPDFAKLLEMNDILDILKVILNALIIPINLTIGFLNTIIAVVQSLVFLLRFFSAIIGLDLTGGNTTLQNVINGLDVFASQMHIPTIPYLEI